MKKNLLSLALALVVSVGAFAQTMTVDTKEATVSYLFVKEKVKGSVKGFDAKITFNKEDLSKSTFEGTVSAATLTTGNKMRDKHLQTDEFFDTKKFPEMSFKSTSLAKTEKGYKMKGKLTIKDITNDVTINFIFVDNKFEGKMKIYTNDFKLAEEKERDDTKVLVKFSIPVK